MMTAKLLEQLHKAPKDTVVYVCTGKEDSKLIKKSRGGQ